MGSHPSRIVNPESPWLSWARDWAADPKAVSVVVSVGDFDEEDEFAADLRLSWLDSNREVHAIQFSTDEGSRLGCAIGDDWFSAQQADFFDQGPRFGHDRGKADDFLIQEATEVQRRCARLVGAMGDSWSGVLADVLRFVERPAALGLRLRCEIIGPKPLH